MSAFWDNKKVLVTGCTGFLGYWLAEHLLDQGAELTGLVKEINPQSNYCRYNLNQRIHTEYTYPGSVLVTVASYTGPPRSDIGILNPTSVLYRTPSGIGQYDQNRLLPDPHFATKCKHHTNYRIQPKSL